MWKGVHIHVSLDKLLHSLVRRHHTLLWHRLTASTAVREWAVGHFSVGLSEKFYHGAIESKSTISPKPINQDGQLRYTLLGMRFNRKQRDHAFIRRIPGASQCWRLETHPHLVFVGRTYLHAKDLSRFSKVCIPISIPSVCRSSTFLRQCLKCRDSVLKLDPMERGATLFNCTSHLILKRTPCFQQWEYVIIQPPSLLHSVQ